MPAWVEQCVSKIHGTNPRTKKPYTDSEKWAICQAAWKKKKAKAAIEEVEFVERDEDVTLAEAEMDKGMERCMKQKMRTGKAKSREEASEMCKAMFKNAEYDTSKLEFFLDKELIEHYKEL